MSVQGQGHAPACHVYPAEKHAELFFPNLKVTADPFSLTFSYDPRGESAKRRLRIVRHVVITNNAERVVGLDAKLRWMPSDVMWIELDAQDMPCAEWSEAQSKLDQPLRPHLPGTINIPRGESVSGYMSFVLDQDVPDLTRVEGERPPALFLVLEDRKSGRKRSYPV